MAGKKQSSRTDHDSPWKEILEHFFPQFMQFFFLDAYELFNCRVSLDFPVVKLLDYREKQAELEASPNPFAIVVLAHLETQKTRRKPEQRYDAKLRVAKMMYRKGYNRQEIINLFRFVDWIMTLPENLEQQFMVEIARLEEDVKMPYVTSVERIATARGLEQGLLQGRQEGRQEGQQEGQQEGLRESIVRTLELRFGLLSPRIMAFLQQVQDVDDLRELHKQAVLVSSLAVFEQGIP
jgi:flagellar biosynthesis/type III secretory pathway protein FliH